MPARLPLAALETLFLDAGNTLLSIDFRIVAGELARHGVEAPPAEIQRAEAKARPALSDWIARSVSQQTADAHFSFLANVLDHLLGERAPLAAERARIADAVAAHIYRPGASDELWNVPLAGVAEALGELRALGIKLVVVSNADGTVERGLTRAGLRGLLDVVVDSHLVGFEKPDPRIFAHALEASGARPETTLHVGDLYAADVAGARAAGVHALLLDPHDDWPPVDCARLPGVPALARMIREARAQRA
ncbi:MAG TPA: HAD family hydrolase [Myxococcota bacterium]|nr:HAD family hydrolase [Myxococcota bacterium]